MHPMTAVTITRGTKRARHDVLLSELSFALERLPKATLQQWALDSVARFREVTVRRVRRVGGIVENLGRGSFRELSNAVDAFRRGELAQHTRARVQQAAASITETGSDAVDAINDLKARLVEDPSKSPDYIIAAVAFLASSGGLDGDGGAPDLDLLAGIDAHRSIFTHSIISGAMIETVLASTAMLIGHVYDQLPTPHDRIWDSIHARKDQFLAVATRGASFGVAYHLGVDAVVEPAAFHDLPVSIPMGAHVAIIGTNAIAEGLDAGNKGARVRGHPDFRTSR